MTDKSEIIDGLESHLKFETYDGYGCGQCPYDGDEPDCVERLIRDTLGLLKEQEL